MSKPTFIGNGVFRKDEVRIKYKVSGAEPTRLVYGDMMFDPSGATFIFHRYDETTWLLHHIVLFGPNLRKDGSHGRHIKSNTYAKWKMPPAWLEEQALLEQNILNRGDESELKWSTR